MGGWSVAEANVELTSAATVGRLIANSPLLRDTPVGDYRIPLIDPRFPTYYVPSGRFFQM